MKFLSPLLPLSLAIALTACTSSSVDQQQSTVPTPAPAAEQSAPQGRIIPVTAELWKFTPNVIQVKQGEIVTLQITGMSGTHGLSVPKLEINEVIIQGQTVNVRIPTNTPGTYDFLCSISCGSGHSDMKGQIVIEP